MMAELIALTMIPILCIGFMVFSTITWYRLERKVELMREEKRYLRKEIDALRERVKTIENN